MDLRLRWAAHWGAVNKNLGLIAFLSLGGGFVHYMPELLILGVGLGCLIMGGLFP